MARRSWLFIIVLAVLFTGTIGALQYKKYSAYEYNGLDLGIYTQVVWSLAHGQGFATSIHDPSYLGDHLELWLVPLAGLYRLWSNALLLLWVQTIVLVSSVWPITLIARRLLGERFVIPVAVLWLVHPLIYNPAMYEFHGLVFALPILGWSIWFYLEKKFAWWLGSLVALVAVREDMPLLVAGWALLALVDRRQWRWWVLPGVLAMGWFFGAQSIIRDAGYQGTYKYLAFYRWLGDTPLEMATYPFRHPLLFLRHIFSPFNWQTVISLFISFGLLPWWGRRALLPVLFIFGQLLLLGADAESVLRLHYVLPYLPFLAWAAFEGWRHIRRGAVFPRLDRSLLIIAATIIAISGPLYTHSIFGAAELPWRARLDVGWTDANVLRYFAQAIHPNERLLTTFNLLPHLANRPNVYSLNYLFLGRRQYTETAYTIPGPVDAALIDWQQYYHYQFIYKTTLFGGRTGSERLEQFLRDNNLRLVSWIDSVALYRRDSQDPYIPTSRDDGQVSLDQPLSVLRSQVGEIAATPVPGYQQLPLTISWLVGQKLSEPLSIRFTMFQAGRIIYSHTRLLGQGPRPSYEWTSGQVWTTNYRLAIPPHITGDVAITADVVALTGRMRLDRWRAFTPVIRSTRVITSLDLGTVRL